MNNKTYVSSAVAAEMLHVSLRTIQLWVESGELKAWKTPGGHRRIPLAAIKILQQKQQVDSGLLKQSLKVLVVEDSPEQRTLYQKFFDKWQLPVDLYMADNGFNGLIKIGEVLPDLLIADLLMPEMDGVRMISAVKNVPELKRLDILAVTSMDRDAPEVKQLQSMGVKILFKPIPFAEIELLLKEKLSTNDYLDSKPE